MPNKKYKIAVIQLNLNDVAENNLKKCLSWVRDAASQGAEKIFEYFFPHKHTESHIAEREYSEEEVLALEKNWEL